MGEVWLAWDTELGRWAALKFLKDGDASTTDDLARFKREAQMAAKLSHPHIASVYEVGESAGRHFIAMQYVEGQTLRSHPRDDVRQLVSLLRDAARAIQAAHDRGVIHRDLKPDNLMVQGKHIFVMDFGLARATHGASRLSVSGLMVGTPSYMPPEQARGEKAGPAADIYSLGATLYELVTDRRVFDGDSIVDIVMKVIDAEPVPPRRINPRIDVDLETIILKSLEKEPSRRYGTSDAFAADLDRWLDGEPISARPASLAYRLRKGIAKRKGVAAALLGGAVAVALVLAWLVPALSSAKAQALEQMRKRTDTALRAAIEVRRAGGAPARTEQFAEETREACEAAAAMMPELAEPHYRLGRMHRARFRFAEAMASQDEALRREPGYAPARFERGLLRTRRYAELVSQREGGVDDARRLAIEDLREAGGTMAQALVTWLEGDTRGSLQLFDRATSESPEAEETWNWAGHVAMEVGDLKKAVDYFTKGTAIDRGYAPNYRGRALAWHDEGDRRRRAGGDAAEAYRAAIVDYEEAMRLLSVREDLRVGRAASRVNWALACLDRGEDPSELLRQAVEDLDLAVRLSPAWFEPWVRRAAAWHNLGNWASRSADPEPAWDAAERDYTAAIERGRKRVEGWMGRGQLRATRAAWERKRGGGGERWRQAIEDLDLAVNVDPRHAEARQRRADARATWGRSAGAEAETLFRAAEEDYAEAERLEPSAGIAAGMGGLYVNWGIHAAATGDPVPYYEKAVAAFDRAIALIPTYAEALAHRAQARTNWGVWLRGHRGDPAALYDAAIRDYGDAIAIDARPEFFVRRGDLKVNRGIAAQQTTDPSEHYAGALSDFAEAAKRNPSGVETAISAVNARGAWIDWLKRQSRTADAQRVYDEFRAAIEAMERAHPKNSELRWRAGICHQLMGAWSEALAEYDAAIALEPALEATLKAKMEFCRSQLK